MRGVRLVAGCLGLLVVAYAADRWLQEILKDIGTYGAGGGREELQLAIALVPRLVLLAGLVAIFTAVVNTPARRASGAVIALGALIGVAAPLAIATHLSLPDGLPFVRLSIDTSPLWGATSVFLLWTAIGLVAIAVAAVVTSRGKAIRSSVPALPLAIGAGLLFVMTYLLDDLYGALAMDIATGLDAYPVFVLVGLATRAAVMGAFAVLLACATARAISRVGGFVLLGIGVLGFVVLPVVGLLAGPAWPTFEVTLVSPVLPGTAGRWLAAAMLVAGAVALLRPRLESTAASTVSPDGVRAQAAS